MTTNPIPSAAGGWESAARAADAEADQFRAAQDPMLAAISDLGLKTVLMNALLEAERSRRAHAAEYRRFAGEPAGGVR